MKKKKFIYIIGLLLFFQGCDKYFDIDPVGKSTEESFYSNINEMQSALNAVYSVLRESDYQKTLSFVGDGMSDDFIYQYGTNGEFGEDGQKLQNFKITSDNEWVRRWYKINYKGIYRANQLLANINNEINIRIDSNNYYDLQRWQHIYGQTLFLRSYFYFNLVRTFGGVPLVPEVIDIEADIVGRSTLEESYQYIEKDLRTACVLLRNGYSFTINGVVTNSGYGEATRYAGMTLLMRVLITQCKNGDLSPKWTETRTIGSLLATNYGNVNESLTFDDILHLQEFYPDYSWEEWKSAYKFDLPNDPDLNKRMAVEDGNGIFMVYSDNVSNRGFEIWPNIWRVADQNLESNGEPIFVIPALIIVGVNPDDYNYFTYADALYATSYSVASTNALIPSVDLLNFLSQSEGLDPRNYYGVYSHNLTPNGDRPSEFANEQSWGGLGSQNYQMFVKHFLLSSTEAVAGSTSSPRNLILMRYSDMVLMYAEALNETGEQITAIDIINALRENIRNTVEFKGSGFPYRINYGPYVYVRDRIRNERRRELAGEKFRYFDLLRYGIAGTVIPKALRNDFAVSVKDLYFTQGVNELFPIPQVEIELSHGAIEQNPGY